MFRATVLTFFIFDKNIITFLWILSHVRLKLNLTYTYSKLLNFDIKPLIQSAIKHHWQQMRSTETNNTRFGKQSLHLICPVGEIVKMSLLDSEMVIHIYQLRGQVIRACHTFDSPLTVDHILSYN